MITWAIDAPDHFRRIDPMIAHQVIRSLCLVILMVQCGTAITWAQRSEFHIYKGDEKVGNILIDRRMQGEAVHYRMESYSEFQLIWTQAVRTSVVTEYLNGTINYCHTSIKVNDAIRDSSFMRLGGTSTECYVHPEKASNCGPGNDWTTARMYYEEPVRARSVYVESVLADCVLETSGPGTYTLTFPNDTKNHYIYRNGILHEIQVIRPFFDLVFKRA